MRFLSSSALAMAPKLMFAASCSAADAMVVLLRSCAALNAASRERRPSESLAGRRLVSGRMWDGRHASATAPRIFTEPPAFSIAATRRLGRAGDLEGELRVEFAVAEDLARRRAASSTTPAATSASTVTGAPWSSLPASIASWMRPRLTSLKSRGVGVVEAALRQAPMERHLAALEALDGDAGAGLLALDAAAARSCPCRSRCRGRRACASWWRRRCRGSR